LRTQREIRFTLIDKFLLQDTKVEIKSTPRSETRMKLYEVYEARKTSEIVEEWMKLGKKKSASESPKC